MPDSILDGLVEGFLDALAEREKVAPLVCCSLLQLERC